MPMPRIDPEWFHEVERAIEFVTLMDTDDRLLYVNHPQPGSEGYVGRPVFDFVDPAYHEVLRRAVTRARKTGIPQHFDSNAVGPDGETSTYSNWVFGLPRLEQDLEQDLEQNLEQNIVAIIATDVTQQGRIEAALELSQITLRSLVENSPDSILIVDRDRRILFINRDDLGFQMERIIGAVVESFVSESERPKVVEAVEHVLMTGEPNSYDNQIDTPQGKRWFTTRLSPIVRDNAVDRVMLVATDITERHQAEQQRRRLAAQLQQAQKMEAIGQLTGGVAHDFNNLLTAISGNLELARLAEGEPGQAAFHIEQALEAVRRGSTLTQRLLAFSRKQALRPQTIDANTLVASMQNLLQRTLGETIEVRTSVQDRLWKCQVDPAQLENALLNLAVNARDAMPRGGELVIRNSNVTVGVDLDAAVPPGDFVRIEVIDTGTGMVPEVVAQAFEPFFTTKDVGHGSGLGLSMVYGFVRQSGGHVQILSEPGRGTSVEIYLPSCMADAQTPLTEPTSAGDVRRGNGELVLLVEDDAMVRALAARILQSLGYRTVVTEFAQAALKCLAAEPEIKLILSDVVLPGGTDGFELAKQARQMKPDLPVLFVSGYPQPAPLRRGGPDRVDAVLQKPYTTEQLARAVGRALDREKVDSRPPETC